MQPLKNIRNIDREEVPSKSSRKKERNWILEYQWKSKHAWNTYPAWWFSKPEYSEDWIKAGYSNYISPDHAVQQAKKDIRSYWLKTRYEGKNFRVRHKKTGEIIPVEL